MLEAQNGGDEYSISREREREKQKNFKHKILKNLFFFSFTPKTGLFIIEFAFLFSRCWTKITHAWSLYTHCREGVMLFEASFGWRCLENQEKRVATCFYVSNLTDRCVTKRRRPLKKEKKIVKMTRRCPYTRNWNSCFPVGIFEKKNREFKTTPSWGNSTSMENILN